MRTAQRLLPRVVRGKCRARPHALLLASWLTLTVGPAAAVGGDGQAGAFGSAAIAHGARSTDPARAGIWKALTPPPGLMHGEFAGLDPIGLAAGVRIPADCSLNWLDPDSGKRYCFSSATSLAYFLAAPHTYLARARLHWHDEARAARPRT